MVTASILQEKARFAPNVLNYFSTFQVETTINKAAGSAGSTVSFDSTYSYAGKAGQGVCIKSYNDTADTPLTWNLGAPMNNTIKKSGTYWVVVPIMQDQSAIQYFQHTLRVDVTQNGVAADDSHKLLCTLPAEDVDLFQMNRKQWYYFAGLMDFNVNDVINFSFTHTTEPTTIIEESTLWIGCVGLFLQDRQLGQPPMYQPPAANFKAMAVLDFPSTNSQTTADLTVSVEGARDNDVVEVGVPASIMALGGEYKGFVSAPNVVTIRFNNFTGSTIDPPSATFGVIVLK